MDEKNGKVAKQFYACEGYGSTHSVEILNYFNPELQLKDKESAIARKLIDLLSELRGFKFVATR